MQLLCLLKGEAAQALIHAAQAGCLEQEFETKLYHLKEIFIAES